ncbi:L-glyceraldehyde 3-phosphate reductase [compost metagenome]
MFERYIEEEVIHVSEQSGIGQIVFSPLAQGILTGKYKPGQVAPIGTRGADESVNQVIRSYLRDDVLDVVQELNNLAHSLELKLSQLSLAWVLRQRNVSSALIGASKPEQIEENTKAVDVILSQDTLDTIDHILHHVDGFDPAR